MQFIRNGCDIPKALLEAYLKGDVVFFCGAGVSKAKAKLPDFTGLTKEVLEPVHNLFSNKAMKARLVS